MIGSQRLLQVTPGSHGEVDYKGSVAWVLLCAVFATRLMPLCCGLERLNFKAAKPMRLFLR